MVGQGGAIGVGLELGQQGHALLVVEIQLEAHHLGGVQGVPHRLMQGIDVAAVHVDGAQQVEGVVPVDGLPQQTSGAGVVGVIEGQDQPLGHDHSLLIGAGPVFVQSAGLIAPDHAQADEEGRGPLLHAVDVVGGRLLVQRVHHAAAGGVHHQSFGVRRPLGQLQQGQLVGHDVGHGRELLAGDGALNVRSVVVVHQPHGVAVRQLSHRPGVGHLRGRSGIFRRQRGRGQQGRRRDAGQQPAHPIVLHVMCSSRRIVKLAFHMYCTTARPRRQPQFAAVGVCLCYTRSYTSFRLVISMF